MTRFFYTSNRKNAKRGHVVRLENGVWYMYAPYEGLLNGDYFQTERAAVEMIKRRGYKIEKTYWSEK